MDGAPRLTFNCRQQACSEQDRSVASSAGPSFCSAVLLPLRKAADACGAQPRAQPRPLSQSTSPKAAIRLIIAACDSGSELITNNFNFPIFFKSRETTADKGYLRECLMPGIFGGAPQGFQTPTEKMRLTCRR